LFYEHPLEHLQPVDESIVALLPHPDDVTVGDAVFEHFIVAPRTLISIVLSLPLIASEIVFIRKAAPKHEAKIIVTGSSSSFAMSLDNLSITYLLLVISAEQILNMNKKAINLYIYNKNGTILNTYQNSDANVIQPQFLAVNHGNGNIAVVDLNLNKVKLFDRNGVFLFSIGTSYFCCIVDIAIDDNTGNIVVSDGNGILIFDSKGNYNLSISINPSVIAIDKNSNIYIYSLLYNYIYVYSANGNYLFSIGGITGTVRSLRITNMGNIAISNQYYNGTTFNKLDFYNSNGNNIGGYNFYVDLYYFVIDGNNDIIGLVLNKQAISIYNHYGALLASLPYSILQGGFYYKIDLFQDNILACDYLHGGVLVINTNNTFATYSTSLTYCNYVSQHSVSSIHHTSKTSSTHHSSKVSFGVKNTSVHSNLIPFLISITILLYF